MECAEKMKEMIAESVAIPKENILIGSVDVSRHEAKTLCVIIPETAEITDTDIGGGYEQATAFTVSFLFRGGKHPELVKKMEETADIFQKAVLSGYSLGRNVTDIEPGKTRFFYDCGTVERQATGLDIELTITETKEF